MTAGNWKWPHSGVQIYALFVYAVNEKKKQDRLEKNWIGIHVLVQHKLNGEGKTLHITRDLKAEPI